MKISDLQKIVEQRTPKGDWYANFGSVFPEIPDGMTQPISYGDYANAEFIAAMGTHIDEIMDVLRAAKRLVKVDFDPIDPEEIGVLKKLKRALEKLESK